MPHKTEYKNRDLQSLLTEFGTADQKTKLKISKYVIQLPTRQILQFEDNNPALRLYFLEMCDYYYLNTYHI